MRAPSSLTCRRYDSPCARQRRRSSSTAWSLQPCGPSTSRSRIARSYRSAFARGRCSGNSCRRTGIGCRVFLEASSRGSSTAGRSPFASRGPSPQKPVVRRDGAGHPPRYHSVTASLPGDLAESRRCAWGWPSADSRGDCMRLSVRAVSLAFVLLALVSAVGVALAAFEDWGLEQQTQLQNKSRPLFGVGQPLSTSSNVDLDEAQALADPAGLVTVAKGLKVNVVTAGKAAPNLDQMVVWPQADPQFIIACNEEGVNQPALQKISLSTGDATTIATGINSCDPVRATPWGTVLFGEENGSVGAMYELIDPLNVVGATINKDRKR